MRKSVRTNVSDRIGRVLGRWRGLGLACVLGLGTTAVQAQTYVGFSREDSVYFRTHYAKREVMVPMRDGVKLHTTIYTPVDASAEKRYPMLMTRTPYSSRPYGADAFPSAGPGYPTNLMPSTKLMREGYILVQQDVRGRYMSEGEHINMTPNQPVAGKNDPKKKKKDPKVIDESTDTWDTVEWLVRNVAHNNGRVGQWGISYPGFYTAAGMIDAHPALVAVSPQAPIVDWFTGDDFHRNGALWLPHGFNFLASFGLPRPVPTPNGNPPFRHGTPDGYKFFLQAGPLRNLDAKYLKGQVQAWTDLMAHDTYDSFWQVRNLRPHLKNIRPAVMTVGGWFDAENLYGALKVYQHTEQNSPGGNNKLVFGPWVHGGWTRSQGDYLGDMRYGANTSEYYQDSLLLPFFRHHLKQQGADPLAEATMFRTGTNSWHKFGVWPPKETKPVTFYFHPAGQLKAEQQPEGGAAFTEWISDPAKPVPYYNAMTTGMERPYMTADQRFAATRPDVVVFETEPLAEDFTAAGPIQVRLRVATTGTDADWVVKVIDVLPDNMPDPQPNPTGVRMGGYQMLIRGEVMRGKFRNSFEQPEPFVPGQVTEVTFTLNDVFHTFKKGHRLMIQVQNSWFPMMDRNPQQFLNINTATEADFKAATMRLYHGGDGLSAVTFLRWDGK